MVITLISLMIFSIKANKTVIIITMVMVMSNVQALEKMMMMMMMEMMMVKSNVQALEKADIQFVQHSYPDENHSLGGVSRFFQDIIIVITLS